MLITSLQDYPNFYFCSVEYADKNHHLPPERKGLNQPYTSESFRTGFKKTRRNIRFVHSDIHEKEYIRF